MPSVPYSPVPTVAPSTGQPSDYIGTQASPLDFGAQVGAATEKLGNTLGQTGDMLSKHAMAFQELDNETMARDAGMKLAQSMGQAWADYRQKEGKDAYDSYPGFVQGLQGARQSAIDTLPNPQAKELLSAQSAYLVDRWQMMGGSYAADQRKEWMVQSHRSNQATAVDQATLFRNDPQTVIGFGNSLADSIHQEGQMRGWSDDQINANIAAGKGALYRTVIGTLAAENPAAASSLFDKVKGQLDGQSTELITRELKGIYEKSDVAAGINTVMGGAGGSVGPASLKGAIAGQEGSSATAVSVNGAKGKYQVTPGFFQQYAQPGEDFNSEKDRTAVAERGIDALNAKYNGDASRVAVAYFSGENNVAPPGSATPWITDKKDGNGTSTSTYVRGVMSRMGGGAAQGARPYAIGDSLAAGLHAAGGFDGGGVTGANPQTVLANVNALPADQVQGRNVVLSTGASNNPAQIELVSQQIDALKAKGAASVTVVGVGDRSDLSGVNDKLAAIAQQSGVQFAGAIPSDQLSPDHVHPASYGQLATSVTQHHPEAFGMEADMMNRARAEAQQRFPDRPDLQKSLVDGVWQEIQQNNALQLKYEAETQKAKRDAEEDAGQQVVKTLMTPGTSYDDLVKTIRDNPNLTADQKLHLWAITQAHYGGETQHDVKTYGSGFWNLYQQVHAPQDDPNRITDVSQLWQHGGPNGDLTLAGIEKLTGEIQGRRTPDGEAAGKMQQGALAYAKHELSFEADLGVTKIRDPKGEGIFNVNFLPAFFKAYDAGITAGKSPYQLLSKDSPDFIVDKLVSAYKRTPAQISQDMLSENSGEAPSPAQPAAQPAQQFDMNTQAGIIASYNAGKMTRDQAAAALVSKGFARAATAPAPAAPTGPQVPR